VSWWPFAALALGGLLALVNFHLSFLAAPLHRFRHGTRPVRIPSGIPIVGSLLLGAVALVSPRGSALQSAALALLVLDTGGPHWFLASLARGQVERWGRRG
jgi:hypothetical protein